MLTKVNRNTLWFLISFYNMYALMNMYNNFKGSQRLTREDIESVFCVYDRVCKTLHQHLYRDLKDIQMRRRFTEVSFKIK